MIMLPGNRVDFPGAQAAQACSDQAIGLGIW